MTEFLHYTLLSLLICREGQHARRAIRASVRPRPARQRIVDLLQVTPFLYYGLQLIELTARAMLA